MDVRLFCFVRAGWRRWVIETLSMHYECGVGLFAEDCTVDVSTNASISMGMTESNKRGLPVTGWENPKVIA